jgi:ATP-binding cassette subfamily B protein
MNSFIHEDQVKTNITYGELFRRLWPYGKKSKGLLVVTLVSIITLAVSSRVLPFVIGYAIDEGILKKDPPVLFQAALAFLFFEIIKSISEWAYLFFFQKFGNRVLFYVRENLIQHIESLPIDYFNRTPTGRIVTRATNDVSNLGDLFTEGIITVFTEMFTLGAILVAMILISWKLALVTMFLSPLFIGASIYMSNQVRKILRESKIKLSALNSFVAENLNGIKIIQIYNRIPRNRRKFKKLSEEYRDLNLASIRAYAFLQPVMNLFNAVTISIALIGGTYLVYNDGLAIGAMVAFLMNVQDFISPLREILDKYQRFQNSLTSAERVFQMLDETPECSTDQINQTPMIPLKAKGALTLKNLNFRYQEELPLVLTDINLSIIPGESIALVGRTGSGKSTLVSLLQRFYQPPPGTLWLDGCALESIPIDILRSQVGVVLQDNFIFRGTIRDNINLEDPQITDAQIERACAKIEYHELLARSGRTLNSWVEERGANLSVGERQLLAFARILAFEPQVLILDEATANVDSQTEILIHKATVEMIKGRTSLIIAHRLSTVKQCDRIVVLDQGKIKEVGSHDELVAKKGMYHRLVHSHSEIIGEVLT